MLRWPHGDYTIHEIKKSQGGHKEAGRWRYGDLKVVAATKHLPHGRREATAKTPWGRRTIL